MPRLPPPHPGAGPETQRLGRRRRRCGRRGRGRRPTTAAPRPRARGCGGLGGDRRLGRLARSLFGFLLRRLVGRLRRSLPRGLARLFLAPACLLGGGQDGDLLLLAFLFAPLGIAAATRAAARPGRAAAPPARSPSGRAGPLALAGARPARCRRVRVRRWPAAPAGGAPGVPTGARFLRTSTCTTLERPWLKLCRTEPASTVRPSSSGPRAAERAGPCRYPDRWFRSSTIRWPRPFCSLNSARLAASAVSPQPPQPRRLDGEPLAQSSRARSRRAPHGHDRTPGQAPPPEEGPNRDRILARRRETARAPPRCRPMPAGSAAPDQSAATHAPCRTPRPPARRAGRVPATRQSAGPAPPRARQGDQGAQPQDRVRPWRRARPKPPWARAVSSTSPGALNQIPRPGSVAVKVRHQRPVRRQRRSGSSAPSATAPA